MLTEVTVSQLVDEQRALNERLRFDAEPYYNKLKDMTSTEELRGFFSRENIRGIPHQAGGCVVAAYLSREVGYHVTVDGLGNLLAYEPGKFVYNSLLTPSVVLSDFVRAFDQLEYPDLVDSDWFENGEIWWLPKS